MGKKITIEPITRVEGHGKVTIHLNDQGEVEESRLHIVEFRGFERFVQGRPYWEVPVLVQRLCGICPVSHHLAAAKAIDRIVGITPETIPVTAEKMRRLMHYGQVFQSHALHFFYLASPDLLFGMDSPVESRNIIGVALKHREFAKKGILMRKFGQEIILATAGKKIHGISAVPGGIHKNLSIEERDRFLHNPDDPTLNIKTMIDWSLEVLEFYKDYHQKNLHWIDSFATFPSNFLSLVRKDGAMDLYHGVLRAIDSKGTKILPDIDYQEYLDYFQEEVKSWSFMKFPFLKSLGPQQGWYRVGPLARLNTCDFIPTPLAQKELDIFRSYTYRAPNGMTMHSHHARLIEMLHCAEIMDRLLNDPDLQGTHLIEKGTRQEEGVGVIEAPRGTLLHHYRVAEDDQVTKCNLIVSTTHNNTAMNKAVRWVAENALSGKTEITEGLLNQVEVAIRAYDPCLSCATHALGQMPLEVLLFNSKGEMIDEAKRF
ncbi:MAG: Ni/Fe hydrogenase subunit alpha [Planctomycetota bacterium]